MIEQERQKMYEENNFLKPYKKNLSCRTFIIAEAGVHHNCKLSTAKKLIDAAHESGADAIKFQTYKSGMLVTKWAPKYWQIDDGVEEESQFDYFQKRDKFEYKDYQELSRYAGERGIVFCSTPFDRQAVKWLNDLDVPFWKIASADIDNFDLLHWVAQTKKPIILSTGASFFKEISKTVDYLQKKGVKDIALLHCNLAYPTPNHDANLNRIVELKKRYPDCIVGYSDHTIPDEQLFIPSIAVALGAQIIEKHFTLNRTLPEDDHYHSVDPVLLTRMVERFKLVEESIASTSEITDSEIPARKNARRSLVAIEEIAQGTLITMEMLAAKRPGGGIPVDQTNKIIGRRVKSNVQKDQQIKWDLFEGED